MPAAEINCQKSLKICYYWERRPIGSAQLSFDLSTNGWNGGMMDNRILNLIKDDTAFVQEGNVCHFISEEISRPNWSKALDEYLTGSHINLKMKRKNSGQRRKTNSNDALRHFAEFVSASDGIKVDLASGPSGYFAPFLDTLKDSDCFIITDACPAVIRAHADACRKPNCYILDADLDKGLPFKDESVDIFTGNLLNNVENYGGLIRETCRCLKPGGKLAVIEMFFDKNSKTQNYLAEQGKIWSSYERFVGFCESVGFTWIGSETVTVRKGPASAGDLYPLDKDDCSTDKTVYFEKKA